MVSMGAAMEVWKSSCGSTHTRPCKRMQVPLPSPTQVTHRAALEAVEHAVARGDGELGRPAAGPRQLQVHGGQHGAGAAHVRRLDAQRVAHLRSIAMCAYDPHVDHAPTMHLLYVRLLSPVQRCCAEEHMVELSEEVHACCSLNMHLLCSPWAHLQAAGLPLGGGCCLHRLPDPPPQAPPPLWQAEAAGAGAGPHTPAAAAARAHAASPPPTPVQASLRRKTARVLKTRVKDWARASTDCNRPVRSNTCHRTHRRPLPIPMAAPTLILAWQ